jgi:hypothetical protein
MVAVGGASTGPLTDAPPDAAEGHLIRIFRAKVPHDLATERRLLLFRI